MTPNLAQNLDEMLDRAVRERVQQLGDELTDGLREECSQLVDSAVGSAVEQARAEAQATGDAAVDALAECSRKIRQASAVTEIAAALVESAAKFSGRAALFIHRGDRALGFRVTGAGVEEELQLQFQKLSLVLDETPALAEVTAKAQAREVRGEADQLGKAVTELLGLAGEDRIWLLPVALRDKVLAVLYLDTRAAEGETGSIHSSAIEILVALSEAWIEAVGNRKKLAAA